MKYDRETARHVVETPLSNKQILNPRTVGPGRLRCVHRLGGPERGVSSNEASINVSAKRIPGQKWVKVAIVGAARRGAP